VLLKDLSKEREALVALRNLPSLNATHLERPEFRVARWTVQDLDDWYAYLLEHSQLGVPAGSHIDYSGNRIVFTAADDKSKRTVMRKFSELPIPCHLVAVGIQPTPRLVSGVP
jgi:hypothetical protein